MTLFLTLALPPVLVIGGGWAWARLEERHHKILKARTTA